MVLNATLAMKHYHQQELAKKRQSIDNSMIRFPKLDFECAHKISHFHYEYSELNNFHVSLIINENCASRQAAASADSVDSNLTNIRSLYLFVRVQSLGRSWTVRRNLQDFRFLDIQLHKCVFDRKHSKLQPLNLTYFSSFDSLDSIVSFIDQYLERLSQIIAGCCCGLVLHFFETDNRGNRFINEESDINTPAIGAAFVIKRHNKSDVETEISLEIGELVSVIEMPPVNESFYWKGKKGFEVGFFPAECVQLIDDKISRQTEDLSLRPLSKCTSPTLLHRASDTSFAASVDSPNPPHSNGAQFIDARQRYNQSEMRKHGIIAALLRTFASGGRRREELKRSGILKERVFSCDLCEYLANSGHELPLVLTTSCAYIEEHGLTSNGIYRLSGVASAINRLRAIFDEDRIPPELLADFERGVPSEEASVPVDIQAVSSLLKLYFRELPNPLLTFSLYDSFVAAMSDTSLDESARLQSIRALVISLPPPHWRTLRFLVRHLNFVSKFEAQTGMTPKNLAIVWAPNLLRSRDLEKRVGIEALHVIGTQAVLTEFLILNCDKIFDREEYELHPPKPLYSPFIYSKQGNSHVFSKCLKYIDVGPEIIPGKYHTIISMRPSPKSKRSKFTIQNFKKFHFFSTRSHNVRTRPSLFGDEPIANSSSGNFRKLSNNFDGHSSSESTSSFNPFYKSVGSRLSARISRTVKRSQSFDSYFKKLRASSSACSNSKCCSNDSDNDSHTMVDINRNEFEHINKNDTIFEADEMSIDCDSHLAQGNKLHAQELCKVAQSEVNNNLPQIDEEESFKFEATIIPSQVTTVNEPPKERQMDTYCSTAGNEVSSEEGLIPQIDDSESTNTTSPIEDYTQFSLESKSLPIAASKSTQPAAHSVTSQAPLANSPIETDSTNGTDTHSPVASQTQLATNSTSAVQSLATIRVSSTASETNAKSDLPSDTRQSLRTDLVLPLFDSVVRNENNAIASAALASKHSSLDSELIKDSNCQLSKSRFIDCVDSGNVQSGERSASLSPSASTTPTTTLIVSPQVRSPAISNSVLLDDITTRERIDRIKEERRSQIHQQLSLKGQDPNLSENLSRIPVAFRCGSNYLPEVTNSSDSSPVRLRNKSSVGGHLRTTGWRNSEAAMNDSGNNSSRPSRQVISEYRRSVPNLELKVHNSSALPHSEQSSVTTPSSASSQSSPTSPSKAGTSLERKGSVTSTATPNPIRYRRPPIASPVSVEEGSGKAAPSSRAKIAVIPLRTINKRQRINDPKTLALMFEQQNSADNV